jgi:hypothetical protein
MMAMRVAGARRLLANVALALVCLVASPAAADSRVDFLATRLQYPPPAGQTDDFRVRTNAALALGATNDDAAVAPLCGGLSDPNDAVRAAAAVGLRRLARSYTTDCLKRRLAVESNDNVKSEIQRALSAIGGGGGGSSGGNGGAPANVPNAKYYIAIPTVTNGTSRPTSEIDKVLRDAILQKLNELGAYQVAPAGQTSSQARAVMASRKLKGFQLSVSVDAFDYSGGNLRVRVKFTVFSYPEKDLRGEVPASASSAGVRPGDKASEDQLMSALGAHLVDVFAQSFQ